MKRFFPAESIAIISRGELIGDALMKMPYLRALRSVWPKAKISWITSHEPTHLNTTLKEETSSLIDEFFIKPEWMSVKNGQAPAFDLVIDTRSYWEDALKSRFMLSHKLFISPAFRYLFSDRHPSLCQPRFKHLHDALFQTVELAAGFKPEIKPYMAIPEDLKARAKLLLPEGKIYIGLAPGAGGAVKKWPLENYEKVAQHQSELGRVPVFLLGPQEADIYERLRVSVPSAIFPLQSFEAWGRSDISIGHTFAVASLLALAVTNDSGASHLLAAVDCPLVSLFGPTSAEKIAPRVTRREVITAKSFGSRSMDAIPVESVLTAIERLL